MHVAVRAVALTVLFACGVAHAQRGIDAQTFHPTLDSFGIFTVERAEVAHQWDFGFQAAANWAGNPLKLAMRDASTGEPQRQTVMSRLAGIDLGMHLGLTNWLEIALDMPLAAPAYTDAYGTNGSQTDPMVARTGFYQAGPYTNIAPPDAAAGDARLGLKARIFRRGLFGLAAAAIVTFPFGDSSAFLGDSGFTFRPVLIADLTRRAFTAAINVGAVIRQTTTVLDPHDVGTQAPSPRVLLDLGHELTWSAGVAYRIVPRLAVAAELFGTVPLVGMSRDATVDVLGGLQIFPINDLRITVGAGAGVISTAARQDDYRVLLGVSWSATGGKGAGGGIDSDGDDIPDSQDLCPNAAEDRDGFDDEDGCPDPDNDQDGIPDARDRCPNEPEDRDGFEDADGCPDADNDHDGVLDTQDRCPNEAEDRDGFEDDDGCPDADNDSDGIPDRDDKCPNEPETRNGVDDQDGCPDSGGVMIGREPITLDLRIAYASTVTTPNPRDQAELARAAERLKANPQVRRVRIEAHADALERNPQAVSQARADAVRAFLIARGVEPDRLQAVGYGNARPVDRRKTAEARARNRRVELVIVEQQ